MFFKKPKLFVGKMMVASLDRQLDRETRASF